MVNESCIKSMNTRKRDPMKNSDKIGLSYNSLNKSEGFFPFSIVFFFHDCPWSTAQFISLPSPPCPIHTSRGLT